jgi:hypothetical protein
MTVWHEIDERVLLWVADVLPASFDMQLVEVSTDDEPSEQAEGVTNRQVIEALIRLESYGLVEFWVEPQQTSSKVIFSRPRLTAQGHQVLGDWPDLDGVTAMDTVRLALNAMAEQAPEKASLFRRAVGIIGEIGTSVVLSEVEREGARLGDEASGRPRGEDDSEGD